MTFASQPHDGHPTSVGGGANRTQSTPRETGRYAEFSPYRLRDDEPRAFTRSTNLSFPNMPSKLAVNRPPGYTGCQGLWFGQAGESDIGQLRRAAPLGAPTSQEPRVGRRLGRSARTPPDIPHDWLVRK